MRVGQPPHAASTKTDCEHKAECADNLDRGVAAEKWTDYCDNRVNLEAIRTSQRHIA